MVEEIRDGAGWPAEEARHRAVGIWTLAHGYCVLLAGRRIPVRSRTVAQTYLVRLIAPLLVGLEDPVAAGPGTG